MIHVTESFGGGVAAAIRDYCRNFPSAEHHLVFAPRSDAPVDPADMGSFASVTELRPGHFRRIRDLRRYMRRHPNAVIHAHSSFAGAYVRASIVKTDHRPIIYTPHCYGFERRDSGRSTRSLFWLLEWLFSFNTTVFAACSKREEQLSNWPMAPARSVHVPNVASSDVVSVQRPIELGRVRHVVGAGRLGPQKDPSFFRDCILALRDAGYEVDATWIGGGDLDTELMLAEAGIAITGWLPRPDVLERLKAADVYIHSARWEGFPIAVLEASLMGVPIVARDIAAFAGIEMPLLVDSPEELVDSWPDLESADVRLEMVKSTAAALANCNDLAQAEALRGLYQLDANGRSDYSVTGDSAS
nr:glycosyltransferase [Arthrobacter sp. OV608]